MKKLNVTQGEIKAWEVFTQNGSFWRVGVPNDGESVCNITTRNGERAEGNANLIADSITTYNKCGKLPSELMEEREEMKEIIATMTRFTSNDGWDKPLTHKKVLRHVNALLTKIENNQTPQPNL